MYRFFSSIRRICYNHFILIIRFGKHGFTKKHRTVTVGPGGTKDAFFLKKKILFVQIFVRLLPGRIHRKGSIMKIQELTLLLSSLWKESRSMRRSLLSIEHLKRARKMQIFRSPPLFMKFRLESINCRHQYEDRFFQYSSIKYTFFFHLTSLKTFTTANSKIGSEIS